MANLLGNTSMPNYVKLTATAILASTYFAALYVAVTDMITGTDIPSTVSLILGTGLSMAIGALGIHQGATLLETPPPTVSVRPQDMAAIGKTTATGGTDDAGTASA